uniref:Uncharacterized protein n=1 Tax=Arion vulgaris TaxID=1028688 RepID=A0A0B7BU74_9EUPU
MTKYLNKRKMFTFVHLRRKQDYGKSYSLLQPNFDVMMALDLIIEKLVRTNV